jgi:hypothetical protein
MSSEVPGSEGAAGPEVQEPTIAEQPEKGDAELEEGQIVSPSSALPKHELEFEWVLWFDNPGGRQNVSGYGQSLRQVYSFKTVEDFWCLFNNIKPPSMFQPNVTYYLFKKGIEPKWESPANAGGGSWSANVPGKGPEAKRRLDEWWIHSVMACIGEHHAASVGLTAPGCWWAGARGMRGRRLQDRGGAVGGGRRAGCQPGTVRSCCMGAGGRWTGRAGRAA